MIRAISITSAVLVLAFGSAVAQANPKTIAVLGLEVTGVDVSPAAADAATEMTKELRMKASSSGTNGYSVVGATKELTDEKMIFSCQDEAPECMKKIASDLGAQTLLYGNIQRKGKNYSVTLKLFDAGTGKLLHDANEQVPAADLTGQGIGGAKWAHKMYDEVTGQSSQVQLTLRIEGSDTGTVRVNDGQAQPYTSGSVVVTVPEGKVHVVVEPNEKMQRYDDNIQATGQQMSKDIKLQAMSGDTSQPCTTPGCSEQNHEYGGTVSEGHGGGGWRAAFVVSAIVDAGLLGVSAYGASKQSAAGGGFFSTSTGSKCSNDSTPIANSGISAQDCKDASTWAPRTEGLLIGAGVVTVFAAVALYEGYLHHDSSATGEHAENGHRKHRERFVLTPVISPDGGGATVRLDW
jgi:hypothetical protein|nr:hypothetical protein [Kofleriaceae bacterium]